jgi:hypothetical protein
VRAYLPTTPEPKKRGNVLAGALVWQAVSSIVGAVFCAVAFGSLSRDGPAALPEENDARRAVANLLVVAILCAMVKCVAVMGAWAWRRWGAALLLGASAFSLLANLKRPDGGTFAVVDGATLAVLAVLVLSRWKDFD